MIATDVSSVQTDNDCNRFKPDLYLNREIFTQSHDNLINILINQNNFVYII